MVNKLPAELDNPLENIINDHIDQHLPFYYQLGFTPNGLTTVSLLAGLIAVALLYMGKTRWAALSWFVAYYYDCADGKLARKYRMTSPFGDVYDHASDIFKHFLLLSLLAWRLRKNRHRYWLAGVGAVLILLSAAQMGAQERYLHAHGAPQHASFVMSALDNLVVTKDCRTQIQWTRFFSPVTLTLYIVGVLLTL